MAKFAGNGTTGMSPFDHACLLYPCRISRADHLPRVLDVVPPHGGQDELLGEAEHLILVRPEAIFTSGLTSVPPGEVLEPGGGGGFLITTIRIATTPASATKPASQRRRRLTRAEDRRRLTLEGPPPSRDRYEPAYPPLPL